MRIVAKSNGVAQPTPPAGVLMGSISNDGAGNNLGSPVTGTAPNLAPVGAFYNNATFGRTVYNVVPTARIDSAFGNLDFKSIFKDTDPGAGNTATICNQTATIGLLGFLVAPNCGSTTLKAGYKSGQL